MVTKAEAKDEGATPRPTGKNSEQDAEIAALKAQIETLTAMVTKAPKAAGAPTSKAASEAVIAARSDKPKTYRALQAGTDLTQGYIPEGTVFTTTQPQGSWMEPVED